MTRHVLTLTKGNREKAIQGVLRAPDGYVLELCSEAEYRARQNRSRKSHDHFFAVMEEMWDTRPEHLNARYPTPDAWRKAALIHTGHCDTRTVVCASKAEADRMVALAGHLDPESIAVPRGNVVTLYTAHSQSMRAMGKATFQKSKDDCLAWGSAQLNDGQEPERAQQAAPVAA